METELWPNLIHASRAAGVPLYLVNARLSERSAQGYSRVAGLARDALAALTAIGAQTEADRQRLLALGAREVVVTGNLKFDRGPRPQDLTLGAHLRELFRGARSPASEVASVALAQRSAQGAAPAPLPPKPGWRRSDGAVRTGRRSSDSPGGEHPRGRGRAGARCGLRVARAGTHSHRTPSPTALRRRGAPAARAWNPVPASKRGPRSGRRDARRVGRQHGRALRVLRWLVTSHSSAAACCHWAGRTCSKPARSASRW